MVDLDERELGRLLWRCRRGMRELDELLRGYLEREFRSASRADQDAFRRLLEASDEQIHAYCLGSTPPPAPELAVLIDRILASAAGAAAGRC